MANSVPLRSYVNSLALVIVLGFAAVIITLDRKNGQAIDRALVAQKEATQVAFAAAEAKGIQHNGLIERMREMSQTYITRGNLYSALIAAGVITSIYALVKP